MSSLDALLKAYMEVTKQWSSAAPGMNCMMLARAHKFLEKLIAKEMSK